MPSPLLRRSILASLIELTVVSLAGAQTGLTGYVREDSTGRPIAGAEVSIEALQRSTKTDSAGHYTLGDLSDGVRMVSIRKVGYLPAGFMVQVNAGELRSKDFTMERSTPTLDTLRIQATPGSLGRAIAAFNEHRARGFGKFIDAAALQARSGATVADFLHDIPGMFVGQPPKCAPLGNRVDNCMNGTSYRVALTGGLCAMQVRLDGNTVARGGRIDDRFQPARTTSPNGSGRSIGGRQSDRRHNWTATFDISSVNSTSLAAVEIYPRESDIPFEMHGPEQECGLLVLWSNG